MGGLSGCTFTLTLFLSIRLLQKKNKKKKNGYFIENLNIQRIEKLFSEIPEICIFLCENRFQIRTVVKEIHPFKIFLYGIYMGLIVNKDLVVDVYYASKYSINKFKYRHQFHNAFNFSSKLFLLQNYCKIPSATNFHLSRLMTKPTKWHVRPVKTQISLGIRPV